MQVSVIIPVYNAAQFIEVAVISALNQEEAFEVILIEDGSKDNSLFICQKLAKKHPRVKLYQHPNSDNQGASASRNLGIAKATGDFIAFLDADDFYLENRFKADEEIFKKFPDADGVYNAIGTIHHDLKISETNFMARMKKPGQLTTVDSIIPPAKLADVLIGYNNKYNGYFSTDGITFKREFIKKTQGFNTYLKIGEDSLLWIQCAIVGKLYTGNYLTPVAMRRIHDNNTIQSLRDIYSERPKFYYLLIDWIKVASPNFDKQKLNFLKVRKQYFKLYLEKNRFEIYRISISQLFNPQALKDKEFIKLAFYRCTGFHLLKRQLFRLK